MHRAGLETREFLRSIRRWEREREAYLASIGYVPPLSSIFSLSLFPPTLPPCIMATELTSTSRSETDNASLYERDFKQAFPNEITELELVELVEVYVRIVQTRVEMLESIDVIPSSKAIKGKGRAL